MPKFIGVKNGRIQIVSDSKFVNSELEVLELPTQLSNVPADQLLLNYRLKNNTLYHKDEVKNINNLKIAFVANYGMSCGIATYSKFLYDELITRGGEYKIFAEKFDNHPPDNDEIVHCWSRGQSLATLIGEIKQFEPDIVFIQHEYGLWSDSRQWISMMNQLSNYRIITTMHSVFHHQDKLIVEACIPEIVVHLKGAKNVLVNEKQISSKVYTIPHGCFPPNITEALWNFYKTPYNFMQFGFLFKYKGFENSIRAVAILKNKYPDIYFTGICSESKSAAMEHERYYQELMELVDKLGLNENVGLIRGYQSDNVLDTFLKMNKFAVFPYLSHKNHECFGASGAVPYAMSRQIPVLTSNIHHFENLPTIRAVSPEEIALEADKLFSNKNNITQQISKQNEYLNNNTWSKIASMYISIFENQTSH